MVSIFPNPCLWRRSLRSNLGGIDLEKLYRATLSAVERKELKIIEDSCQKIGRQWPIPYPWKRDPKELPNNEVQANKKIEATEGRLSKHRSMQPPTTDK